MMVTSGDFSAGTSIITSSLKFYPVIRKEGGELYVGLMSGGRYKIPVGTIQMRIDQNEAWTITPQETPVSMVPAMPEIALGLPAEQQEMIKKRRRLKALKNVYKMMSPYTVAGGAKARSILKQMLAGQKYEIQNGRH
ncbi:hypothetical protein ACFS4T_21410 [Pseudomonas lini]